MKFDWDYYRHLYVTGSDEVTLQALSELPAAPALDTLKRYCKRQSWVEQRRQFRHQMHQAKIDDDLRQHVDRLVDIAETIARHLKLSKQIQDIAAQALDGIDPSTLTPRDIVAWVKAGSELERLAIGLATSRSEVSIDLSTLSDHELELIASGEVDPSTWN